MEVKRRGFLFGLLGAPVIPAVAKAPLPAAQPISIPDVGPDSAACSLTIVCDMPRLYLRQRDAADYEELDQREETDMSEDG